ncbi:hypothetical protein CJF30_00007368 [Rutstroemia sp. NJR-2017a BBW]|nr:hypothetical protein CJF30_00007368 [Rutstroemia sp. NJR-2017a BBW]
MRHLVLLFLSCAWFCFSNADIAFTWPVPGALLGSGDVTLWWKEDGDALLISGMGSHLLVLYTGNNNVMSNPINSSSYPSTSIPVLTNYSPRFSLTNMTGTAFTPSIVAANAVCDTTDGPDSVIRMESEDQVAFNIHAVLSLSAAQVTTSGAIGNPTRGAAVTNIPLTPSASSRATTSSPISSTSASTSTVPSSTATPIPTTIVPQTPTPAPSFTQDSHKKIVIAVPVSIGVAILIGLLIFFCIRHRRQKQDRPSMKAKPSTTSSSSILPFFPPPPTHPNTWVDNSALTLKGKSNRFWSRLKAKRPRRSVAELPGYENPSIRNPTPDSVLKFSTNANVNANRNTSTSSQTPIVVSSVLPRPPPPPAPTVQLPAPPAREVGFAATGPAPPTSLFSGNHSPFPQPAKHHQHLTVNTSRSLPPRPKSQTYPSDEKTIQTATTGVSAIPSSTALSFEPIPPPPFDYISPIVQGNGPTAGMNGHQQRTFRSPMARRDESAAVREAELRIRGLLGGGSGGGSGVVSPVSSVSR